MSTSRGRPTKLKPYKVKRFIHSKGIAKSQEIADEFEVTDVAVRKALTKMSGVESRKLWRGRIAWYIPSEISVPQSDGYGDTLRFISVGRLYRYGGVLGSVFTILAFASWGLGSPYSIPFTLLALVFFVAAFAFKD